MFQIAELIADATPTPFWRVLRQLGVEQIVSRLPSMSVADSDRAHGERPDQPWSLAALSELQSRYHDAGFTIAVIEDSPPMERIRLGLPGRDEEIDNWCTMLRAMGALSIPVVLYHWMAVLGFQRTSVMTPTRGGALTSRYVDAVSKRLPFPSGGQVDAEQLWSAYEYFLHRVLPVAEEAGVRLAVHPDDPPVPAVRGISRIFSSVDGFDRALGMSDSASHGITLCQGNFALMTDDLPGLIRRYGRAGRIFYVHFRDVRGRAGDFIETFHDDGQTDMSACMQAYADVSYSGVMRSDHVPTMEGEPVTSPSYSDTGRVFALGYQIGLREAAFGPVPGATQREESREVVTRV